MVTQEFGSSGLLTSNSARTFRADTKVYDAYHNRKFLSLERTPGAQPCMARQQNQ